ncbi:hypothetical protein QVD17_36944 [Tagetes erecta]|uniref:Uncharacterized protein n=1 Tax=Tagetes erecta TaxID=13708 RepID=A0AAD8JTM7_TARER|nr:hypothetical protein QVD17_36944 [Tagetes erecta]
MVKPPNVSVYLQFNPFQLTISSKTHKRRLFGFCALCSVLRSFNQFSSLSFVDTINFAFNFGFYRSVSSF